MVESLSPSSSRGRPHGRSHGRSRGWPRGWSWLPGLKPSADLVLHAAGLWDASAQQSHASFDAWCAAMPGRDCRLWLSMALTHETLCDGHLPLRGDPAALAWATRVLVHYHGDAAAAWPLAAWWGAGRRGVSALHGVDLLALQNSAKTHRVRLQSVRPWWPLALAHARHESARHCPPQAHRADVAFVLAVEADRVCVLQLAAGKLVALQQRRLQSATSAALQVLLNELLMARAPKTGPDPADPAARVPFAVVGWGLRGDITGFTTSQALDATQAPVTVLRSGSAPWRFSGAAA
jgi:hypothetical protein